MVGWLARALAGHDKEHIYIIIEETKDDVFLVDGIYKTMAKPKKKNKRHIQIWKNQMSELEDIRKKLLDGQPIRDEEIKRAIKLVMKSEMEE